MKNIYLTCDPIGKRYIFTESMNPADGRRKIWNLEEDSGLLKKLGLHVDPSRESSLNLYDLPKRAIEMVKDAYDGTMVEVVVRRQRELLSK